MTQLAYIYLSLGFLLIVGMLLDNLGRRTKTPRVTLLMLFGLLFGHVGFDLIPTQIELLFPVISQLALLMICFLLGGRFTKDFLQQSGSLVAIISIAKAAGAALFVFFSLLLFGFQWDIALLLAAISTATDPAATVDVVEESGVKTPHTKTLLAVTAIDDLWGILVFTLSLSLIVIITGSGSALHLLGIGIWEVVGAVLIGSVLSLPLAYFSGRAKTGIPTQLEALGIVFLCGGFALIANVSYLLTALVAGALIANFAKHHTQPFHEIERIDQPFLILFFMLAGASLHLDDLLKVGGLGLCYITFRALGTWVGSWIGVWLTGDSSIEKKWFGLALLPQAGVAMGMALIASEHFPHYKSDILTVAIGSTVIFELLGPLCTRFAIDETTSRGIFR